MQDGRCFTIYTASKLFDDYLMTKNGISLADNHAYRLFLQKKGPALFDEFNNVDKKNCGQCNKALLNVKNIY